MKTIMLIHAVLTRLSPIRGSSVFNMVVPRMASEWVEELRKSANDDLIVPAGLSTALAALAGKEVFEDQQAGIVAVLEQADALLDMIQNGSVDRIAAPEASVGDLIQKIIADTQGIRDVFRPSADRLKEIRAMAAQVCPLIDAEIMEGNRPEEHKAVSNALFHHADHLDHSVYQVRDAAISGVIAQAMQLAA